MNNEIYEKIAKCNSVDEVLKLAKDNGKNITKEEAEKLFNKVHNKTEGELSDNEINNVAGGTSTCDAEPDRIGYTDIFERNKDSVRYIFEKDQEVEIFTDSKSSKTKTVKITDRKILSAPYRGYYDTYKVSNDSRWYYRSDFKKA